MTGLGKFLFLLLRTECEVPRAWREAGEFLRFHRTRLSAVHQAHERSLIGMWNAPLMIERLPEVFGCRSDSGKFQFRIRESVGVNGLWELCWLDTNLGPGANDPDATRKFLIAALIEEQQPRTPPPNSRFAPIFDPEKQYGYVHRQTDHLKGLFPGRIGEPAIWNKATGAITTLSSFGEGDTQT